MIDMWKELRRARTRLGGCVCGYRNSVRHLHRTGSQIDHRVRFTCAVRHRKLCVAHLETGSPTNRQQLDSRGYLRVDSKRLRELVGDTATFKVLLVKTTAT